MAFTYGFYNSKNHDRPYNAEQMSAIFDGVIKDGVFSTIGNIFAVAPGEGLQVTVDTGKAWFNHTWNVNDSIMPLPLATADVQYSRIDAVVLEINRSDESRTNTIRIVQGSPSSAPQKPELTRSGDLFQYPLAYVTVDANAVSIDALKIEKVVGKDPTPFVTGILESVDISSIYTQWNAQFNLWFDNVKAQLEGDVVTNLQRQIELRLKISDKATEEEALAGVDDTKYLTPATGKKLSDIVGGSDKSAKYKRSTRFKTELTTSNLVLKMPFYAIESYALYWDALINKTNYVTFKDMSNPTVQDRFRGLIQTEKNILGLISINTSATSETSSSHVARYCIAVFDAATGEYLKALPLYGKYESGNQYYKVWYAAECEKEAGSAIALTYAKSQYCIIDLDNLTSYLGCIIEDTHYVTRGATAAILKTKIVALPQSSGSSPILNHIDKTKATANFESAAVTGDLSAQTGWTSKTISVASQGSRRGILKVSGDIVWVYVAWYNSSTTRHSKLYVQKYDFSSNPTDPEESTVLSLDFSSKHSDVTCTYLCHDDTYAYFYVQPFVSFGSSYSTSTRKYNKKVLRVNMTSWDSNFSDISFEDTTDTKVDLSYLNRIFYINATASYLGYIDHDHYFCTASYASSSRSTSDMLFAFNDQTLEIETIPYLSPARMIKGTSFGSSSYDRSGKFKAYPGEIIPGTGFLYYYPYVIDVRSRKAYKPTFSISTKWNRYDNYVALTTNDRQVEVGAKDDTNGGKENALYVGYFGNVKNKVGLPYASRVAVTTNGGLCNSDLYLEAFDITEEVVAEPVED